MAQFKFKNSSCVAIGTFNIYVVQPKLLAEMGVFKSSQPIMVLGDFTQPGIRFEVDGVTWVIRPERLAVESANPDTNCGQFVEKTLEALCWTPVMAIGINSVFTSAGESESCLPPHFRLPELSEATLRAVHVCVPYKDSKINVAIVRDTDGLTLSLNSHTDFSGKKDIQKTLNESVRAVCRSFVEHRTFSVDIVKKAIGAEFVYE